MTLESWVTELDQGAEFVVEADVKLSGRMVRFGRGMIERVTKEVFTEFATRLEEQLRNERDPEHAGERAEEGAGPSTSRPAPDTSLNLLPLLWRAFRSWTARTSGVAKPRPWPPADGSRHVLQAFKVVYGPKIVDAREHGPDPVRLRLERLVAE